MIGKLTKNRILSFLFGTGLTAIVQSSSAITVLAVGLVNSGLIELSRALGLIIGANLGTTARNQRQDPETDSQDIYGQIQNARKQT